ncbi:MAG TPA: type VI secretion system baseplate subunit TssF [Aquabacterium sp.]|nr:type VI secretion system baseplate subunit TssF [Aquabacterium sp.]
MDPRLLKLYNQELQHVREMGAEFARQFPKIAGRLGMDGLAVSDPYVERLIEGFAFLTSRVQLKLDAEFPRFSNRLAEIVYPHFLAPTPSMAVTQFEPLLADPSLLTGFTVPRGTRLTGQLGKGDQTACEFVTAQDVRLWPLKVDSAEYFSYAADLSVSSLKLPPGRKVKGGIRITLSCPPELSLSQIALDDLRLHFSGADDVAYKLYERVMCSAIGVLVCDAGRPPREQVLLPAQTIVPVGFEDHEALLPVTQRGFEGYRLLQEYFAFPQRFLFADFKGVGNAIRQVGERVGGHTVQLIVLLDQGDTGLEGAVDAGNFQLNCTPAINLFEKRCDRIHVTGLQHDFHVVPDRTRPMDFEVYELKDVTGYGAGGSDGQTFKPFYAAHHTEHADHSAYYAVQREPRLLSATQKRVGPRSSYIGSELFISLVDQREAPYSQDLRQLGVLALCTNRDMPLHMPIGVSASDFLLDITGPIASIKVLRGPSKPISSNRDGSEPWRLINQLSLNYLSLTDTDPIQGAAALRELLSLHGGRRDQGPDKQIEGVRHVKVAPTVRRLPMGGPITFGRGQLIELEVDDFAFQGASAFLLASVLERFMARYASINTFTELRLSSSSRGLIKHWGPRCGSRPVL